MTLRFIFKIFDFYKEGFKNLTLGKTLWKIIFIKLFIILIILKLFVFDVNFKSLYKDDVSKSNFVIQNLISKENQ
ncbi:DUF4492 domain-containing protein [Campylobacter upsaliensis]|uniref:Membrane protein n=1 Tax=Campylobacter upsaliensis TaxID=28080 RepID=A0A381EK70_CAMUP|nr:DUF4492 domain-containing protein [Campylobacter upsaliensis]EAL53625.1 probable membrane protein Cj0080 [Campylobacter upsaliensis RM3195]MCR2101243.1 DUF4492 domain-containing protein [Campylobacter upsaliensis]MCR2102991.1 DUF4492 domain-containing protein [Campylobacter upsaliensis]MCR2104867.1 DUF4492 domain-containing protein [Campylobacter upsaliensis]MCR2108602.1 DUF4492 domain-containing protein [Campylobacter upsaliensis]